MGIKGTLVILSLCVLLIYVIKSMEEGHTSQPIEGTEFGNIIVVDNE